MWMMVRLLTLMVCAVSISTARPTNESLRILVILSTHDLGLKWTRGEEVFAGAQLAAEELNTRADILRGYVIKPVPVLIPNCSVADGILRTVKELVLSENSIIGVAGLFCNNLARRILPLLNKDKIGIIQLSGAQALRAAQIETGFPHTYSVLARFEHYSEAVLQLLQALGWTKIGVLNSVAGPDNHYVKASEIFVSRLQETRNETVEILLHAEVGTDRDNATSVDYIVETVMLSKVRVVVAFISPYQSLELVCKAYQRGLIWPMYAWILVDVSLQDIIGTKKCVEQLVPKVMKNVIIVQQRLEPEDRNSKIVSGNTYSSYLQALQNYTKPFNVYSSVMYDSIWGISLAANQSLSSLQQSSTSQTFGSLVPNVTREIERDMLEIRFAGASGKFEFCNSTERQLERLLQVAQIQNESLVIFGTLQTSDHSVIFNLSQLGHDIPTVQIPRVYATPHIAATVILLIGEILCVLFVSFVLAVYIYYRKQPEVKATSRYLSICIFIGCYSLLLSALIHTLSNHLALTQTSWRKSECFINILTSSLGLDLILATVIAKTLRVAYVFTHIKRTGTAWSDRVLLFFIALVACGKLLLVCLWHGLDTYLLVDKETYVKEQGYYCVVQQCYSQEVGIWLSIVLAYTVLLSIILLILAYKTRKIKRENFKDTKKLNALTVGIVLTCLICTALWGALRIAGQFQASKIIASIGYTTLPVLCQVFLFLPKIYPPFRRHIEMFRPTVRVRPSVRVKGGRSTYQSSYHRVKDSIVCS